MITIVKPVNTQQKDELMNKTFFRKEKRIPLFLVPKVRKRYVPSIYKDHGTAWKLFAEGALRNKVFHDDVLNRGSRCLACGQPLNSGKTKYPHIEKHHHCYIRLCVGTICLTIQPIFTGRPKTRNSHTSPIAGSVKHPTPIITRGALKKSSPFTANATVIFTRWSKCCLTGSTQCFGMTLHKPRQNK